jgi:hypothetical protein
MPATKSLPKISRRGFRNAPAAVKNRANDLVDEFVGANGGLEARVLAELRPASYCGAGSAGDRGAYMLSLHSAYGGFELHTVEAGS